MYAELYASMVLDSVIFSSGDIFLDHTDKEPNTLLFCCGVMPCGELPAC